MFIILSISLMVSLLLTPYLQYMVIHQGISSQHKPNARKSHSTICRWGTPGC